MRTEVELALSVPSLSARPSAVDSRRNGGVAFASGAASSVPGFSVRATNRSAAAGRFTYLSLMEATGKGPGNLR